MKRRTVFGALAAVTYMAGSVCAQISEKDVRLLQQQVRALQKQREEDRAEIERLKQQLGERQVGGAYKEPASSGIAEKFQQPVYPVPADSEPQANLVITGFADVLYSKTEGQNGTFKLGSFSPIFLFRMGDKALFEGELELGFEREESGEIVTEVDLEYAQIDYAFTDHLTGIVGRFLSPLGTFPEKLHAAWINKLPTFPLPYEEPIVPFNDLGVQARGAFRLGPSTLAYAAYVGNGPGSRDVEIAPGVFEQEIDFEANALETNGTVTGGGRIGFFHPFSPGHDVEFGVSGAGGPWDQSGDLMWSALVVDAAVHWTSDFEIRGEFLQTWQQTAGGGTLTPVGWWAQAAYKLGGIATDLPLINQVELVFRYSFVDTERTETATHQYAMGLIYYLTNTLQLKADYEIVGGGGETVGNNRFNIQAAYGF